MRRVFPLLLLLALLLAGCQGEAAPAVSYDLDQVPAYAGEPYVVINDNQPFFGEEEYTTEAFETYSALDGLGRCGTAYACVGEELMPAGERESISSVKPSGWINVEYGGQYLYNRCHLIGFQLTGENANERNLITGTRYMNVEGMLPFENLVADYVKETSNHVLYRVTPLYEGDNLVASGVLMEAGSVEDERPARDGHDLEVNLVELRQGFFGHYLLHSAELGDPAVLKSADVVGVEGGLVDLVENQDYRLAQLVAQPPDGLHEIGGVVDVQVVGAFPGGFDVFVLQS